MVNVNTLKRQHDEIAEVVENIKSFSDIGRVEKDAAFIANQINILAGKLKIHLSTEDQYMYPELLKDKSVEIRKIAKSYMDEMGTISEEFINYKNKFNTRTKILSDTNEFINETKRIFVVLEKRIDKEDKNLYPIIQD